MLKANEKKVFEKLLEDPTFTGKKWLDFLYWANTTKPKYKKGDVVVFTESDRSRRIYGKQLVKVAGTVKCSTCFLMDKEWKYDIDCVFINPAGEEYSTKIGVSESEILRKSKANPVNKNWGKPKEHHDQISVSI